MTYWYVLQGDESEKELEYTFLMYTFLMGEMERGAW